MCWERIPLINKKGVACLYIFILNDTLQIKLPCEVNKIFRAGQGVKENIVMKQFLS